MIHERPSPLGSRRLCPPAGVALRQAKPGQILISPRVLTKVKNAVQVEAVGEFELKGIRRFLAAYNVVGALSAGRQHGSRCGSKPQASLLRGQQAENSRGRSGGLFFT
jgi:hypothetical protein